MWGALSLQQGTAYAPQLVGSTCVTASYKGAGRDCTLGGVQAAAEICGDGGMRDGNGVVEVILK